MALMFNLCKLTSEFDPSKEPVLLSNLKRKSSLLHGPKTQQTELHRNYSFKQQKSADYLSK